jgi:hypothetical protein
MQRFRFPFLDHSYDRPTQYEDRKARFGRHRFVEAEAVGAVRCPALLPVRNVY